MTRFLIFSLLIALTSASIGHIEYYGYHGPFAPLSSDGTVVETPEVAHARAAHLAAHAAAAAGTSASAARVDLKDDELKNENDTSPTGADLQEKQTGVYDGPLAPLGDDGRVINTPEVARAKALHLAAHAEAVKKIATEAAIVWDDDADVNHLFLVSSDGAYTIPLLYRSPSAQLASDGGVMDTPEVAEAKAAHLRAYAHTATLAAQHINDNCHC